MKRALVLNGIMALSTLTRADSPPPVESVEIRTEGLYVNGEPFFPVGIDHAAHWHYSLPEAGDKGFNLVKTHGVGTDPRSFRVDVDDAYANGMYAAASLTKCVGGPGTRRGHSHGLSRRPRVAGVAVGARAQPSPLRTRA